jgi:hypothetical protein
VRHDALNHHHEARCPAASAFSNGPTASSLSDPHSPLYADLNHADFFTKPLCARLFTLHRNAIMGLQEPLRHIMTGAMERAMQVAGVAYAEA